MILSGGVLKTPDITIWQGRTDQLDGQALLGLWWPYSKMYRSQLWVSVLVNKRAKATARLPFKTYRRADEGREDARDHPYAQLLRRPNAFQDPYTFWLWTVSTLDIYGEAFWGKVRDPGGRPVQLAPLHPTTVRDDDRDGDVKWFVETSKRRLEIDRRDLVHFRYYNPDPNSRRGMSPLEPLRATLQNEDGARRANSALWNNGGRPSVLLKHPKTLTKPAGERLSAQWAELHGGVDNWGKTAVLEEGMEAQVVQLNIEELQYIEARKLNREETCAAYDTPPPVVHILDHATFSNITEQMRSMYRDTMAPLLGQLEATADMELRDGRFGEGGEPDFGDEVYGEFLLDEVLRGDFEVRATAYQAAINSGWMQPAEVRVKENMPFVEGSDRLFVNSTLIPIDEGGEEEAAFDRSDLDRVNAVGQLIRAGFDPEAAAAALGLPTIPHLGLPPVTLQAEAITEPVLRTLMGRLSRAKTIADVDPVAFLASLNGVAVLVAEQLAAARADGETVDQFKSRLRALKGPA